MLVNVYKDRSCTLCHPLSRGPAPAALVSNSSNNHGALILMGICTRHSMEPQLQWSGVDITVLCSGREAIRLFDRIHSWIDLGVLEQAAKSLLVSTNTPLRRRIVEVEQLSTIEPCTGKSCSQPGALRLRFADGATSGELCATCAVMFASAYAHGPDHE